MKITIHKQSSATILVLFMLIILTAVIVMAGYVVITHVQTRQVTFTRQRTNLMASTKLSEDQRLQSSSSAGALTVKKFSDWFPIPQAQTILLWGDVFDKEPRLPQGQLLFETVECPVVCNLTADRHLLPKVDAVVVDIFHEKRDVPLLRVPRRSNRDQIFVFYLFENPIRSADAVALPAFKDLFNLTYTYLDDPATDIVTPDSAVKPRTRIKHGVPTLPTVDTIAAKTGTVVWVVSNCNSPSSRYEYVNELSKHIRVDVYGQCGNDTCPRNRQCVRRLNDQYKFYLAFENGFCRDYITEKVFRTLRETLLVPVILGGGEYSRVLPRKSYVDVRNYPSPKHLAEYLLKLDRDHSAYLQYHQWRLTEYIVSSQWLKYEGFCRLCEKLHNRTSGSFKSNFDPTEYWSPKGQCLSGDRERRAVHLLH